MKSLKTHLYRYRAAIDQQSSSESGRIGYLILWLMGAPVGLLLLLWVLLGDNLIGKG